MDLARQRHQLHDGLHGLVAQAAHLLQLFRRDLAVRDLLRRRHGELPELADADAQARDKLHRPVIREAQGHEGTATLPGQEDQRQIALADVHER